MEFVLMIVFIALLVHTYIYDDSQKMMDELDQCIDAARALTLHIQNVNNLMSEFLEAQSISPQIFENCASKGITTRAYADNNSPITRAKTLESFKSDILEVLHSYDPNAEWSVQTPIEASRFCISSKRDTYRLFKNGLIFTEFEMPVFSISAVIKLLDIKS